MCKSDANLNSCFLHHSHVTRFAPQFLLQRRANVKACDKMGRNALMHAIKSQNLDLVNMMMDYNPDMHATDKEWGWSPLHYAAQTGSIELCADIIDHHGDVYAVSKKDKSTALDIAETNDHEAVVEFLREYIFMQPAQNMTPTAEVAIWLGKRDAAYPGFATDRGFQGILSIFDNGERLRAGDRQDKTRWLDDEEDTWHKCVIFPKNEKKQRNTVMREKKLLNSLNMKKSVGLLGVVDEGTEEVEGEGDDEKKLDLAEPEAEDDSAGDWPLVIMFLKEILKFIDECMDDGRTLLIHDDDGGSFATAYLVIWLCTRKKVRVADALEHVAKIRREAVVSAGVAKGMKKFQESLDTMKLKRLEKRLRNSDVVSIGF